MSSERDFISLGFLYVKTGIVIVAIGMTAILGGIWKPDIASDMVWPKSVIGDKSSLRTVSGAIEDNMNMLTARGVAGDQKSFMRTDFKSITIEFFKDLIERSHTIHEFLITVTARTIWAFC